MMIDLDSDIEEFDDARSQNSSGRSEKPRAMHQSREAGAQKRGSFKFPSLGAKSGRTHAGKSSSAHSNAKEGVAEQEQLEHPMIVDPIAPTTPPSSTPALAQPTPDKKQHCTKGSSEVSQEGHPAKRRCQRDVCESVPRRSAWLRPDPPEISKETSLTFFVVAIDEHTEQPPLGFTTTKSCDAAPSILLHGSTRQGCSVLLHVHGALPYFYAEKPAASLETCREALESVCRAGSANTLAVVRVEEVSKTPLMGYHADRKSVLRITLKNDKVKGICQGALKKGVRIPHDGILWQSQIYEGNVSSTLRFLVDAKVSGGCWIEVPNGSFMVREQQSRISFAQIEADAHVQNLKTHESEGEWLGVAPLRMLSLHIRTVGEDNRFVAGAAVLQVQGEQAPLHEAAWYVDLPKNQNPNLLAGANVISCPTEMAFLEQIHEYILQADADIFIGYDLLNGHLSSVLARVEAFKVRHFGLGRLRGVVTRAKNTTFETRQLGKHETKEINVEGRLLFDLLTLFEREQKLVSYSLSALVQRFLGESRLELGLAAVGRLAGESPWKLAEMALQDARFGAQIFQAQHFLFRYVEMARVTGVPIEFLLTRGQSVKVFSMILRKAREHDFILPPPPRGGNAEETYEGGAVLEPKAGFYDEPIVTLDFASLYPSIMQRHNLCYSTLLLPGSRGLSEALAAKGDDCIFEIVPTLGHRFVTSKVRKGLLPMVLQELLAARASAKKAMKSATDPQLRAVLDGRQLALKMSANSVYGFTGMSVGMLPCQAIAASVTAYGRQMIERTRNVVEERFCIARGFQVDARVIYGDTDSVIVSLGSQMPLTEVFKFGVEAADLVSKEFGAPVKMEFEKIYFPFLLMNKKRYAGLTWNKPEEAGKLDAKGIETVRRDWCELVRQVVDRCLRLLLQERSTEKAIAYVQESIANLRSGQTDPRLLVVSKALVREGADAYAAKQAHVELAEKLRQRNPATAPQIGDRVPYVFIVAAANTPAYKRAEDPRYALENELPLDAEYYIEHQLKHPLLRIFEPILQESEKKVEQRLFGGGARQISRSAPSGAGPLAAFVRKRAKCIGCRNLLPPSGSEIGLRTALCEECAKPEKFTTVLAAQIAICRPLEAEAGRLFSQCVSCEGRACTKLHVDCANVDCPIFYRRFQVAKDLESAQSALRKLQLDW